MASRELELLGRFVYSVADLGQLAANTEWRPSARDGGAELGSRLFGELKKVKVFPPRNPDGTAQALDDIWIILGDTDTREYVNLTGNHDFLMTPPDQHLVPGPWYDEYVFGDGILDVLLDVQAGLSVNAMLRNTTLKYLDGVTIVARAGASAITVDFAVELWGYRYDVEELPKILPVSSLPGAVDIMEVARDRRLTLSKGTLPITRETWLQLPGGPRQAVPRIMPFARWARNARATTQRTPYEFRFETGDVASAYQNLYFDYESNPYRALLVERFGVRWPTGWGYAWVHNTGDKIHEEHPRGRFRVAQFANPIHFGAAQPLYPDGLPLYFPIPRLAGHKMLIYRDKAYAAVQDSGTPVAANSIVVALAGIAFDLR